MSRKAPSDEEQKTKAKLLKEYRKLLDASGANEMSIKPFLDANPSFIPTPWLLNHHLHFGVILPQFQISAGITTDYVYLTKSSTTWWCVFVEFESPTGRFFTNSNTVTTHSDLTRGLNQIDTWRDYLKKHKEAFLSQLDPLRVPMNNNPVDFRYVLVMGRRAEFENSPKKVARYSDYETGVKHADVRVMTYDAVASDFESLPLEKRHTMKRVGNMLAFERYDPEQNGENLWDYLTKDQLKLSPSQIDAARASGVLIDDWLEGKKLTNWGRDVAGSRRSIRSILKSVKKPHP